MSTADGPTVSVIIPTHNRAHLVGQSIQSVLDQTFTDLELIVVDDGSTDETETVVRGFDDARINYTYQDHTGIGAARNTGLRKAQGRYIAFLDSDDVWLPDLLEVQVPILREHLGIGLVYAKAQAIDKHGKPMNQIRGSPQKYPGDAVKSALYGDFVCIIATLVRRECFDRVGPFDETLMAREDWDMWIRIAKYYRLAHVDKVLARFRTHDDQRAGFPIRHFMKEHAFTIGGSLFGRRRVFETVGMFDGRLISGGDRELGNRVQTAGFKLYYDHDNVMRHPARSTFRSVWSQYFRIGKGTVDLRRYYPDRYRSLKPWSFLPVFRPATRVSGILDPSGLGFAQKCGVVFVENVRRLAVASGRMMRYIETTTGLGPS